MNFSNGTQAAGSNQTRARNRRRSRVRKRKSGTAKTTPLTPRQRTFVSEYAQVLNGSRPAKRAGCKVGTSRLHASRLLRKPHIQKALQRLAVETKARLELSAENVLQDLSDAATFDPRNLLDEHGHVKPIQTLDERTARGIASFKRRELYKGRGKNRRCIGVIWKFRFDRLKPLVTLAKCQGLI